MNEKTDICNGQLAKNQDPTPGRSECLCPSLDSGPYSGAVKTENIVTPRSTRPPPPAWLGVEQPRRARGEGCSARGIEAAPPWSSGCEVLGGSRLRSPAWTRPCGCLRGTRTICDLTDRLPGASGTLAGVSAFAPAVDGIRMWRTYSEARPDPCGAERD